MKFSEKWLRQWVSPNLSTAELAEQLTMAGLEVDSVEPAAADFDHVVVAEVVAMEKHPAADKLNLCTVDVGDAKKLMIICGAANVFQGAKVPAAKIGAVLPAGLTIKKAKLRGVESFGMLCSEAELGMAEQADGLFILPSDAPVGKSIRDYLELDDRIIEVDFTPNRGDCLSVAGMAREVGALNEIEVTPPKVEAFIPTCDDTIKIKVNAAEDCPRYLGRVIKNINSKAETPIWMKEHLRRAGLRSLSPTVDVTNYVLLEYGQPLHAFDLDKLDGGITVRRAQKNEQLVLLDEAEVTLDEDILVIADDKKSLAFAGVMGGLASSVTDVTNTILLECAFFSPDSIRGKARRFGMQTDSSYRFERGVDFQLQEKAIERATQLIVDIAGGEVGPVVKVENKKLLPSRPVITLRKSQIERVLGVQLNDAHINSILLGLGMQVKVESDALKITPPSYRFDIAIEADLIEELARVYGYNNIPDHMPISSMKINPKPEARSRIDVLKNVLVDRGFSECITYSFVDSEIQQLLDPDTETVLLENPISAEMTVMRTTLWSSLLKTLCYNRARQQSRIRIFEVGMRFYRHEGRIKQERMIAGIACGSVEPANWSGESRKVDFFDLKGDVEAFLGLTQAIDEYIFIAGKHSALHPGQTARIMRNGNDLGYLGMLHPSIQKKLGITGNICMFELNISKLQDGQLPEFKAIGKFPSIKRDLALVVEEKITAQALVDNVLQVGGLLLKQLEIFDIYRGNGVAEGKKSLAIGLTLQDDAETLTDDKVEIIIEKILISLKETVGATLRV